MTRAAILSRVSTEEQAADDRHSLPMQRRLLLERAAREGWEVVREFEIRGESAYVDEIERRPEFAAAVACAERGEFDVLMVYDFSRFARSHRVAHEVLYRLKRAGVRLVDASGVDYTEDEDRAAFEAMFSRRASRDHSRRVRDAIRRRHELGLPTGDIPFGYRRVMVRDGLGNLVPDTLAPPVVVPEEAEAIRWAYRAWVAHGSYLDVAREFNRRGLRPRSKPRRLGPGYSRPANEEFGPTSVQRILENRFYLGYVTHRGVERRGRHEPIVDEELWQAAQARKRRGSRAPKRLALLSGLAVCFHCGRPVENTQSAGRRRYYRERRRGGRQECPAVGYGWYEGELHAQVDELMRGLPLEDGRFWEFVNGAARKPSRPGDGAERAALVERRRRAGHALVAGSLTEREHDALVAEINAQLARLSPVVTGDVLWRAEQVSGWRRVWGVATAEEKGEALREVFRAVPVDLAGKRWGVDPWPEYDPLISLVSEFVSLVRPGGAGRSKDTWRGGVLYLPEGLVA